MRKILLTLFVGFHVIGWGQELKTEYISGVVNTYYKVININSTEPLFTLNKVDGLQAFDKVMIIQMKGATVSTGSQRNDPPYGSITNLNNAGNYEIATICRVNTVNSTVTLTHQLLNDYDVAGKVQLVKIPKYERAVVNGVLESGKWVNSTGTGGVLAIMANELVLQAAISADAKGYSGGTYLRSGSVCTANFFTGYNVDPSLGFLSKTQYGAYKGETIVDINIDHQGGKGAIATGGGGGNNHNTAGGGGSNVGAGGTGGNNTTSYDGACTSDHPGIGGYALSLYDTKLFMGGGGGAGHGNNTVQTGAGGGHGGGIIFITAHSLVTNGNRISANGGDGLASLGDGASGGGGGGSIVLKVSTFKDVPTIMAKGGKGGAVDNEGYTDRCMGEGGGGGGGAVYFVGAAQGVPAVDGGSKGDRIRSGGCKVVGTATSGIQGGVYANYPYKEPSIISESCPEAAFLPVKLLYFKVTNKGPQAIAEWKVEMPEDADYYVLERKYNNESWKDAHTIPGDAQATTYQKSDGPLATGIYLYRLKIVEKDRSVHYSSVQQVTIKAEEINRLTIYPNPATSEITIVAPGAQDGWLQIYDMKSRLVHRRKITLNETLIRQDISFLSEGVYMIQVGKLTARFVVFK